jgi:hypothetical protein
VVSTSAHSVGTRINARHSQHTHAAAPRSVADNSAKTLSFTSGGSEENIKPFHELFQELSPATVPFALDMTTGLVTVKQPANPVLISCCIDAARTPSSINVADDPVT